MYCLTNGQMVFLCITIVVLFFGLYLWASRYIDMLQEDIHELKEKLEMKHSRSKQSLTHGPRRGTMGDR